MLSLSVSELIHTGSNDQKALFTTVNKLLNASDNVSNSFTVEDTSFLSFFHSKMDTIYSSPTIATLLIFANFSFLCVYSNVLFFIIIIILSLFLLSCTF